MAHRLLPRADPVPPPEAMSQMSANREAFISDRIAAASSASAAAAAEASSTSEQNAESTGESTEYESYEDYSSGTTITSGVTSTISTGTVAVSTDSNGSNITGAPATTTGGNTLSTSTPGADHVSDSSHDPSSSAAVVSHSKHSGPSPGLIAAAVLIPLILISAIAFILLFLRRRRRRRAAPQNQHHHPMTDRPKGGAGAFMKETSIPPTHDANAPILTNTTNNAYYTGLSTPTSPASTIRGPSGDSARPASAFYEPPPPAYAKTAPPGSSYTLPNLAFPTDPFMDPVSPISPSNSDHTSPTGAALAALSGRDTAFTATSLSPQAGAARPNISRSGTVNSVTSDTYSDTASLHSARPARRSGGAHVIRTSEYAPGYVIGRDDPFEDPKERRREA